MEKRQFQIKHLHSLNETMTGYEHQVSLADIWLVPIELSHRSPQLSSLSQDWIRRILSCYRHIAPEQWNFYYSEHGKPYIAKEMMMSPLYFNISHTSGMMVCAVSQNGEVGVDIENINRSVDVLAIAQRFGSEEEYQQLSAFTEEKSRLLRFYQYWTLKEAFIKAKGESLSTLAPKDFYFLIKENEITPVFSKNLHENPAHWHFYQTQISPSYVLSAALKANKDKK